jgi:hypothetical protein
MKSSRYTLIIALVCTAGLAIAATIQISVSPGNLDGWTAAATGSSSLNFVNGPATPPCGTGSAEFRIDPSGSTQATLTNGAYNATKLNDLTALSYNTFVTTNNGGSPTNGGQAVFIVLTIDTDGNGSIDDSIFFEPRFQDTAHFPSNPQGPLALATWQSWDALHGGWWSEHGLGGATQSSLKSLSAYLTAQPNARIVNSSTGTGGVQLVAGRGGAGDWGNFVGNADCFTIGVSGHDTTTFNFELDADHDGVPDNVDQCPNSDLRPKVDVDEAGPGVTSINNTVNASGCSIQDQVNQCANGVRTHGQYVSCIAHLANSLVQSHTITKAQMKEMKVGAAHSSIGKK